MDNSLSFVILRNGRRQYNFLKNKNFLVLLGVRGDLRPEGVQHLPEQYGIIINYRSACATPRPYLTFLSEKFELREILDDSTAETRLVRKKKSHHMA